MKEKIKKFIFWKTFVISFFIILFFNIIFFGLAGSFEENFIDSFWGIALLSLFLSIIITFFIKWLKYYKSTGKIIDAGEKKQSGDIFTNLFKWNMDEKELKNQIENYDALGFLKSARKLATAAMIFSAIITLIFIMVGWIPSEIWIDIILILILAFFVYKGQRWAMIATMIYWTFSKGFQLVSGFSVGDFSAGNIIMPIIWWAIFMGVFWQAYQVERARHIIILQEKRKESEIFYCGKCGNKLDSDSKFCAKCGEKI